MQSLWKRHHSTFVRACTSRSIVLVGTDVPSQFFSLRLRNLRLPSLTFKLCVGSNSRCIHYLARSQHRDLNLQKIALTPGIRMKTEHTLSFFDICRRFSSSTVVFCEKKETRNDKTGAKEEDGSQTEGELTQRQKLKRVVKEYGPVVIIFHICIALMSLGFFYSLVSLGVDVIGILRKLGVSESVLESQLAAGASTFVIAYAVHKMFAVPRIGITITCAPIIVRKLRQIGVFKPPKPSVKK